MPSGYSFSDTLGMFAVATAVTTVATAYIGGEIRTPLRSQLIGGVGGGVGLLGDHHPDRVDHRRDHDTRLQPGRGVPRVPARLATTPPTRRPCFTFYAFVCSKPVRCCSS